MAGITLWHVPISHYSEKARWALDFKRVPHSRRRLLGGSHPAMTYLLTRGEHQTVPVMTIDGRAIGDSTAIIAELERRFPERPLYPSDPRERQRALDLEEYFDEELGPYIRRLAYHEITNDPTAASELAVKQIPWVDERTTAPAKPGLKLFLDLRFSTRSEEKAREAETKVLEALDRLEAELDGREFLAGDSLSVADVTAASLFYALALPPECPWQPKNPPASWVERMERLRDRPGVRWVSDMYARHRRQGAEPRPQAAPEAAAA